jgi:hypothetical protein
VIVPEIWQLSLPRKKTRWTVITNPRADVSRILRSTGGGRRSTAATYWDRVTCDIEDRASARSVVPTAQPLQPHQLVATIRAHAAAARKFKHCCLSALHAEDAARMRLRTAEGVLVPALFAYAADEFGDEFFDEAWEEFFLWDAFDPFFAFSFVPDSAESDLPPGWPTEPVALHFLHQEVESCPDFHREFIEQACKSYPSFFVVESTAPGRSIDLKDILTGGHFHVLEQSASRTLRAGDLAFTRVITAGGASIMIGASPWSFRHRGTCPSSSSATGSPRAGS